MLIQEFKQSHNNIDIETRVYLDIESKNVIIYQYKFCHDKVLDTNCVHIPIMQFGILTKKTLQYYLLLTNTLQRL